MNCIHITACQLACSPSAFPLQAFQLSKAYACTSTYLQTKLPKISLKSTSATSRYQQAAIVCLFGGKGKSENGDEASPWQALEKAVGNFKKNQSIEDLLRQQISKQEYFDDGGSDGKGPGGWGGDGSGSDSGEAGDDGSGAWDEFVQVMLATFSLIFLYIYIIRNQEVIVFTRDIFKFVFTRHMSFRLMRLTKRLKRSLERAKKAWERAKRKEQYHDPYWLEREILNTPTWFDSPTKYRIMPWYILDSNSQK